MRSSAKCSTPARRTLAKRLVACLSVILGIRNILWPKALPPDGATVRRRLFAYLSRGRREAPQRGRGAYLRRFIEHAQKVTRSYAKGHRVFVPFATIQNWVEASAGGLAPPARPALTRQGGESGRARCG